MLHFFLWFWMICDFVLKPSNNQMTAGMFARLLSSLIIVGCINAAWSLSSPGKAVPSLKGFTGVRFSLYPNMNKEDDGSSSLKEAIKDAVRDIPSLGVEVHPDDVSSCLLGPEPALFEAVRLAFGRAARTKSGKPRNVSMQCTFSAGCPGEPDESPLPPRTAKPDDQFVPDALDLPPRVACQFAIYPLGTESHMETIYNVIENAKKKSCWKDGKSHFCSMLDGDGNDVFETIQSSFQLARESSPEGHVVMTATLTANKSRWPDSDKSS